MGDNMDFQSSFGFDLNSSDFENLREAHEVLEGNEVERKPMEFLTPEEIGKLLPTMERLGQLTLSQLIMLTVAWAKSLIGEFRYPHVTKVDEDVVYQHCIYLAAVRSFSPVLALPHSGQGFSTIREWNIKHPAVLKFEVTVGGLDPEEKADEIENLKGDEVLKHKVSLALQKVRLQWKAPKGEQWEAYTPGAHIPGRSYAYWTEYEEGVTTLGARIEKRGFDFVCTQVPQVGPEDVQLIGPANSCTQARVTITIRGVWMAKSQAEKFAATLSKLCVDALPEGSWGSLEGTELGGIVLYDDFEGSFDTFTKKCVSGEITPLPLPHVGLGQETAKGAPSYNPAAATLRALTNKHVLRESQDCNQKVALNGKEKSFPMGDIVWDSDQFVHFRRKWSDATIRKGVWARWVDDHMVEILKSAVGYSEKVKQVKALVDQGSKKQAKRVWESYPFRFKPAGQVGDGYFYFHRTEVRVELAPLTMETSTQLENLGSDPSGGMFFELQNTMGLL